MRTHAIALICLLGSPLVLAACKQEPAAQRPARPVLSSVVRTAVPSGTLAVGTIEPRYQTNLGFRVLGRVIARPVNVGDFVREGDTIAEIDPTTLDLAVQSARAELSKAQAVLESASASENRKIILIKTNATTKQLLDDAEQARAGAQAAAARAQANLTKALEQLSYAKVRADFAGVITAVSAEVGEVVAPGQTVVALARPEVREAVVDIGPDFPVPLTASLPFKVSLQLLPEIQVEGKIREIAPQADSATRMRRVRIALADQPDSFLLGSTITATLSQQEKPFVRVPASAVLTKDDKHFVWIVDPLTSSVILKPVNLAPDENDFRVTGGLTRGDRIVTAGVHTLKQGQQVRFEAGDEP